MIFHVNLLADNSLSSFISLPDRRHEISHLIFLIDDSQEMLSLMSPKKKKKKKKKNIDFCRLQI